MLGKDAPPLQVPTASGFDAGVRLPMQTRRVWVKCRFDVAKKFARIPLYGRHFFGWPNVFFPHTEPLK